MEHASDMPKHTLFATWVFVVLLFTSNLSNISGENSVSVPIFEVEVIAEYPHDNTSWTQGLLIYNGSLYESKGHYGESSLREIGLEDGVVSRELKINETYFSEGIAVVDDKLIMLTWREGFAFVIDLNTFDVVSNYSYQGEGWGLCYDGSKLIMSDGSNKLYFRDPNTFELIGSVNVTLDGEIYGGKLNELECVNDVVYANLWYEDEIIVVDTKNGNINSIVRVNGLDYQENATTHEILNGIAYDDDNSSFLITGKNWPNIYRVNFVELEVENAEANLTDIINNNVIVIGEKSNLIPILVTSLLVIFWVVDIIIRHKVKGDDVKPTLKEEQYD